MRLINWECLEEMDKLIEQWVRVDAIIADIPYWTTACKWDTIIPFDAMWERLNKLIKLNWAIVLFWSQPFTSALIMSNPKMYKCSWIWEKERPSNFFQAKFVPLNQWEDIVVFSTWWVNNGSKNPLLYNPQWTKDIDIVRGNSNTWWMVWKAHWTETWYANWAKYKATTEWYPKRLIKFSWDKTKFHPTQKPVALMEYLIKTYTNEWEIVLDFTMWSWSTLVACQNTNREWIGIEQDERYFNIGKERTWK